MTDGPDIRRKVDLLKKMISRLADPEDAKVNETGQRYTPRERLVRVIMGLSILAIGLYSALWLGLTHIWSEDEGVRSVSQFLLFIGLVFSQVGAAFFRFFSGSRAWPGQVLFCICFLVSAVIILIGLRHIFDAPPMGIYLMLVGFASCVIAAFAIG